MKRCRAPILHSSSANFTASSSLFPMSQLHLDSVSFFVKKATRCSLGFSLKLCEKTAPTPISEASTSTMKSFGGSGCLRLGDEVNASFSHVVMTQGSYILFGVCFLHFHFPSAIKTLRFLLLAVYHINHHHQSPLRHHSKTQSEHDYIVYKPGSDKGKRKERRRKTAIMKAQLFIQLTLILLIALSDE